MESVFFDKSTMFDRSPTGDIYLGPQRGPPPGLRPAFAGPRRTGFAPGPGGPLHSRLVDDGRSLSPDRGSVGAGAAGGTGFQRMPSSGLTSAFAVSPGKGTALVRWWLMLVLVVVLLVLLLVVVMVLVVVMLLLVMVVTVVMVLSVCWWSACCCCALVTVPWCVLSCMTLCWTMPVLATGWAGHARQTRHMRALASRAAV